MNQSSTDETEIEDGATVDAIVAQIVIGLILLCENILIIVVIWRSSRLRDTKYVFIASLAVTDTIVGLLTVFETAFQFSRESSYRKETNIGITVFMVASIGSLMLSLFQMAIVAADRYLYIAHPFFYQRQMTPDTIRRIVIAFWILGTSYCVSLFVTQAFIIGKYVSFIRDLNNIILKVFVWGFYIATTIVICVCYSLILRLVRKQTRAVNAINGADSRIPKWKELLKSLKFFTVVFGLYLLMTFPGATVEGLTDLIVIDDVTRNAFVLAVILNSGVNFVILNIIDKEFRYCLKNLLLRRSN